MGPESAAILHTHKPAASACGVTKARGAGRFARMKPIRGLLALSLALLIGCGKKAPEQEANQPESNPPNKPPAKTNSANVESIKPTLPLGMVTAKKAHDEGR